MIEQGVYDSQTTAPLKDRSSREITSDGHEVSLLDVLTQLAYRKWLIAQGDRDCRAHGRRYQPGAACPLHCYN